MEYVLTTQALSKHYGHFKALNNLTMKVPKGAIYGFIGKNGAGKTTLIRLICGLQSPTSGEYTLYGRKSGDGHLHDSRRRMGAVVETPSIYLNMSAIDNLRHQYIILGKPSFEGIDELLNLVGLAHAGRKKAKNFSLGMRQRLGIAIALAGDPDFLVLDEPVNDLDPQGIIEIRELILKLNREHQMTFLISSHILDELSKLATHYGFIDKGHIVREISAEDLESACRKCMHIEVSDVQALIRVLDKEKIDYAIISDTEADIYGHVDITDMSLNLARENCKIIAINEKDESLESYYIRLIGGEEHA